MAEYLIFSMNGTHSAFINRAISDSTVKKFTKTLDGIKSAVPKKKWVRLVSTMTVSNFVPGTDMRMAVCRATTNSGYASTGQTITAERKSNGTSKSYYTDETDVTAEQFITRLQDRYIYMRHTNANCDVYGWSYKLVLEYDPNGPSRIGLEGDGFTTDDVPVVQALDVADENNTHDLRVLIGGVPAVAMQDIGLQAQLDLSVCREFFPADRSYVEAELELDTLDENGSLLGTDRKSIRLTAGRNMEPEVSGSINVSTVLGYNLQGLSAVQWEVNAQGVYGADIVGTMAVYETEAGEAPLISGQTIPVAGDVPVILRGYDSRGLMGEYRQTIHLEAYNRPGISAARAERCNGDGSVNDDGAWVRCSVDAVWQQLPGGVNTAEVSVEFVSQARTGIHGGSFVPGETAILGGGLVTADRAWDAVFTLTDAAGGTAQYTLKLGSGKVFMIWEPGNEAIGFGQRPEGQKRLQLAPDWDIYYHGVKLEPGGSDVTYDAVVHALGYTPSAAQVRMGTASFPALGASAAANVDVTFDEPFPAGYGVYVTAQIVVSSSGAIGNAFVVCLPAAVSESGCTFRVFNTRTSALSSAHDLQYMAIGIPGAGARMMQLDEEE